MELPVQMHLEFRILYVKKPIYKTELLPWYEKQELWLFNKKQLFQVKLVLHHKKVWRTVEENLVATTDLWLDTVIFFQLEC